MNTLDPALTAGFAVFGIIAIAVLFLVGRILVCWYFRINEIVKLLAETRDRLPEQKESGSVKPTLEELKTFTEAGVSIMEPQKTNPSTDVKQSAEMERDFYKNR